MVIVIFVGSAASSRPETLKPQIPNREKPKARNPKPLNFLKALNRDTKEAKVCHRIS